MTKKVLKNQREQRIWAAWQSAHAPAPLEVKVAQEVGRFIVVHRDALTDGHKGKLMTHGLIVVTSVTDGVHQSTIVEPTGKVKTDIDALEILETAAPPVAVPQFVVFGLLDALRNEVALKDNRLAVIEWLAGVPADAMAHGWLKDHPEHYDAACEAAYDLKAQREQSAKEPVQSVSKTFIVEPPSAVDDTTPIPALESDANLLAQKVTRLEEQLANATAALDKVAQVAADRAEVIERQGELLEQYKTVADQQRDKMLELLAAVRVAPQAEPAAPRDSASITVDQGYIALPLPEMTTEKGRPSEWGALKTALGGEWRIVYEQIDFANRRYFARVERHHVIAPAEPIRRAVEPLPFMRIVEERGSISSDQIAAQWMGRAVERAEEIAAAAPQVAPMVIPDNPFEAEGEVA